MFCAMERGRDRNGAVWSQQVFQAMLKKPVDETKKVLHNLVSLLLTQQRGESKALPANVL
ncbi:hypothetical protein PPMP20_24245 [Paraburkholderia phymatum]|uniref:hypothetical protein n=1 Tax=Paraburkholderia phymatum TaxID=148447 RepID=UPI00030C8016|nr:hypothetical protein [Paraburkholderia phymatum]